MAAAATVMLSAMPAFADSATGKVAAFDRVAHRVVLDDKSIFSFDPAIVAVADSLNAGDEVKIDYTAAGDDGIVRINSITIIAEGVN